MFIHVLVPHESVLGLPIKSGATQKSSQEPPKFRLKKKIGSQGPDSDWMIIANTFLLLSRFFFVWTPLPYYSFSLSLDYPPSSPSRRSLVWFGASILRGPSFQLRKNINHTHGVNGLVIVDIFTRFFLFIYLNLIFIVSL